MIRESTYGKKIIEFCVKEVKYYLKNYDLDRTDVSLLTEDQDSTVITSQSQKIPISTILLILSNFLEKSVKQSSKNYVIWIILLNLIYFTFNF